MASGGTTGACANDAAAMPNDSKNRNVRMDSGNCDYNKALPHRRMRRGSATEQRARSTRVVAVAVAAHGRAQKFELSTEVAATRADQQMQLHAPAFGAPERALLR